MVVFPDNPKQIELDDRILFADNTDGFRTADDSLQSTGDKVFNSKTTDALSEGSTNFYFKNIRTGNETITGDLTINGALTVTGDIINSILAGKETRALSQVDVFTVSDFGTAIAGVITLAADTVYILKATITMSERLVIATGAFNEIQAVNGTTNPLTYTGNDTFISSSGVMGGFLFLNITVANSTGNATLFNLQGDVTSTLVQNVRLIAIGFASMGLTQGVQVFIIRDSNILDMGEGMTVEDCFIFSFSSISLINTVDSGGPHILAKGTGNLFGEIRNIAFANNPNESSVFIDPVFSSTAGIVISGNVEFPGNIFYEQRQSGTITSFTDASGGNTDVNTTSVHGLTTNDTLKIEGTTNYNGNFTITVIDTDTFRITVTFVADDATGTFNSGSLDQTDNRVIANGNTSSPDSDTTGEGFLFGNGLTTSIPVQNAYVLVNATTWTSILLERMSIINTGIAKYLGVRNEKIKLDGNITFEPATGTHTLAVRTVSIAPTLTVVTFTNGTNLINETATTLSNNDTIMFLNTAGTLPAELRTDTVSFVINKNVNDFQISYTLGGPAITFTDDGSGTNSYSVANLEGGEPIAEIGSGKPISLTPQGLIQTITNTEIFLTVKNTTGTQDINVTDAFIRLIK